MWIAEGTDIYILDKPYPRHRVERWLKQCRLRHAKGIQVSDDGGYFWVADFQLWCRLEGLDSSKMCPTCLSSFQFCTCRPSPPPAPTPVPAHRSLDDDWWVLQEGGND
jgi:hypothetical protein